MREPADVLAQRLAKIPPERRPSMTTTLKQQRVAIDEPFSEDLHTQLRSLPGFDGLVLEGGKVFALFDEGVPVDEEALLTAIATPPPAKPPVEDLAAQYAAAKDDAERIAIVARKVGLA